MGERLPKSTRIEIRKLKQSGERDRASSIRHIAIEEKFEQPWAKDLSNSLKSKGFRDGFESLSMDEKEAIAEYYQINVDLYKGEIDKNDFEKQVSQFSEKHDDLFPNESNDLKIYEDNPFILSIKFITNRFRLK